MANEPTVSNNSLGAPAEGFGQTVSFAFDPRGEVPQAKPITSRGPNVAVSGGNISGGKIDPREAIGPAPKEDATAALLMRVGEGVLNRSIDEARNAEYIKGMQRSMSGEALADIKQSVPWYAKVFGDTPVVEGARAFTAQDTVNKALTRETGNMPKLAKLDSEQAAQHFMGVMKGAMTGDGPTDGVIMKSMTEQMPALMKAQAKANYAYKQTVAAGSMAASASSGAAALQQFGEAYAMDQVTDADFKTRADAFVLSVLPPDGIDEENYQKTMTKTMLGMATSGQFHALNALTDRGILAALTPEQATRVEKAQEAGQTKFRNNYATKYNRVISEINSDATYPAAGQTPADLEKRMDDVDRQYMKLSGSKVGMWSSDERQRILTGNLNAHKQDEQAQLRRQETLNSKAATATAKAQAGEEEEKMIDGLVARGDIEYAKILPGVTQDKLERSFYKQAAAAEAQGQGVEFLRTSWGKNGGYTNKLAATKIQQGLNFDAANYQQNPNSPPSDQWFQGVTQYREMVQKGGLAFANDYFGDHAKNMAFASYMLGAQITDNPNAARIYQQSYAAKDFRGEPMTNKEREELVKHVTSTGKDYLHQVSFGYLGNQLRPETVTAISRDVEDGVKQWMATGMNKEEAVAAAMNESYGSGKGGARGEILGGFYLPRTPGATTKPLAEVMLGGTDGVPVTNVPENRRGAVFQQFLASKGLPSNAGTTTFTERNGNYTFMALNPDDPRKPTIRTFTATDLASFAADKTKWDRRGSNWSRGMEQDEYNAYNEDVKRRNSTPYVPMNMQFGPALTGGMGSNPPSIYNRAATKAADSAKALKPFQSKQ